MGSLAERKAQLRIELNADGIKPGLDRVKQEAADAARQISDSGKRAGDGWKEGGESAGRAAEEIDWRATAATNRMMNSIQRATAAAQTSGQGAAAYYETLATRRGLDVGAMKSSLAELAAAEEAASARRLAHYTMSANEMRNAMRTVPMQFTDIVVSLAGGQSPLQVMLQQGGQLKDTFHGVGGAVRGVASYIGELATPTNGAIAAAGLLAGAWYQGRAEMEELKRTTVLTGDSFGYTMTQISRLADSVAESTGATRTKSLDVINEMMASGVVSQQVLERTTSAALLMEKAGAGAISETVKQFARLGDEPVQASLALDKSYHYLSASVLEQIRVFDDLGNKEAAAALAQNTYAREMASRSQVVIDNAWGIEVAMNKVFGAAKRAFNALRDVGRQDDDATQLANLRKEMAGYVQAPFTVDEMPGMRAAELRLMNKMASDQREAQERFNTDQKRQFSNSLGAMVDSYATRAAKEKAALDKVDFAFEHSEKTDKDRENRDTAREGILEKNKRGSGRHKMSAGEKLARKQETAYDRMTLDAQKYGSELDALLTKEGTLSKLEEMRAKSAAEVKAGRINDKQAAALAEVYQSVAAKEAEYRATKVLAEAEAQRQAERVNSINTMQQQVQANEDELQTVGMTARQLLQYKEAAAAANIERKQSLLSLMDGSGASGRALDLLREEIDLMRQVQRSNRELAAARESAARSWENGASQALEKYQERIGSVSANTEQMMTRAFGGMEDALVKFVQTGKLDFSSLANSIIADLIRMQMRAAMFAAMQQSAGSSGYGGWLGMLESLFSGGGGSATAAGASDVMAVSTVAVAHDGWDNVGARSVETYRQAPSALFANAQRYHAGGWPGLARDEVPAILQTGERVLSRREVAASRAGAGRRSNSTGYSGAVGYGQPVFQFTIMNGTGKRMEASGSATRNDSGGFDVQVMVRDVMVADVDRNGPVTQAMGRAFGLSRRG